MKNLSLLLLVFFVFTSFLLTAQDTFEPNNSPTNFAEIDCSTYEASIHIEGDVDWYQVEMSANGSLKVSTFSVPTNIDLDISIYKMEGAVPKIIAYDDDTSANGGQDIIAVAVVTAGIYLIKVEDENNNAFNAETYTLSISCQEDPNELNQIIEDATSIALNDCFEDRIYGENDCFFTTNDGNNDQDWFSIVVSEAGYLEALLTSVPTNIDLDISIFQIIDGQPKLIANDDDTSANGGQDMEAAAYLSPGIYYIRIHDENNNATNEETYNFCLNFLPSIHEVNQTVNLAIPIALDDCFEERIFGENECFFTTNDGKNDQEWYSVTLVESGRLIAELTSVPTNLDLNLEIVKLVNEQEVLVSNDDDTNANGGQDILNVAYLDPGTYYIHIHDEGNNATNKETFTFCLDFLPSTLEVNQTIDLATPIELNDCFEDRIYGTNETFFTTNEGSNDQNWHQINIPVNCPLILDITSVPTNLDLNMELIQLVEDEQVVVANDNDNNANGGQDLHLEANVTPGIYYIHIHDEGNNAMNEETYTFCIDCAGATAVTPIDATMVFNVTPNPFQNKLIVDLKDNTETYAIQIFNTVGQLVYQQKENQSSQISIETTAWEAGIYFVTIKGSQKQYTLKTIKF